MFGLKKFTKAKTKYFSSDKERKKYFAIQDYYKKNTPSGRQKYGNKSESGKSK